MKLLTMANEIDNIQTNLIETDALIEEHIHGGFGFDFLSCSAEDFVRFAKKITDYGVCGFFPTLATDTIDNLKHQISEIKRAKSMLPDDGEHADILGIHLEACFLNPEKKGIHDEKQLLMPCIENYKQIEDDFIKIVTLAPELDEDFELCKYIAAKGVRVSAGHCTGADLSAVSQVTHLFNAMGALSHKTPSTVLSALSDDRISVEIIADFRHVLPDVVKLVFKIKPKEKIILISDALPVAHSNLDTIIFCGKEIFLKDNRAVDVNGTMAGSTMFVYDIIKQLVQQKFCDLETAVKMASSNILPVSKKIYWDENLNIVKPE